MIGKKIKLLRIYFVFFLYVVSVIIFSSDSLSIEINPRIAIVYSDTSYIARNMTSETEGVHYLYELSSTQHQLMMAGIPFEIIGENDLINPTKISQYTVIVLPSFSNVPASIKDQIITNLENAIRSNGLNVYAFGELMVANGSNSKYTYAAGQAPINRILNVKYITGPVDAQVSLNAMNTSNPVTWRYNNSEVLITPDWYGYTEYRVNNASEPFSYPFQAYDLDARKYFPVTVATKNGKGRTFFSANPGQTVQTAIGRDAVLWLIYEDKPHFGIKLTNKTALFTVRVDADDSGSSTINIPAINNFVDLMTKNNLLGGWYITTNNQGSAPVDWNTLTPYYRKLLNNSFEIGSHSVTHYADLNLQPDNIVYNEMYNSRLEINSRLGINITGFANPGNTPIQQRLWKIADMAGYKYYSPLQDENYKGFGYMSDKFSVVNLQANMISDYELMTLQGLNDARTADYWKKEFNLYYRWGDGIFIYVLWHDYLLNTRYNAYYTFAQYINTTDTEGINPNETVQRFIDWNSQDFVVDSLSINGSEAWSITRLSPKAKYGQVTFSPNMSLKGSLGITGLRKTPDNRSYIFSFVNDTAVFYFNTSAPIIAMNITLVPDWNLISLPLAPINTSIQSIMPGCNYSRIWEFSSDQSWKSTDSGLVNMDNVHGYWVDRAGFTGNCTISVLGLNPGTTLIPVTSQWTLVGYPSMTVRPISSVINSSLYSKIWEYQSDQGWKSTDTGLANFTPGKGYWVYGTTGGEYSVG